MLTIRNNRITLTKGDTLHLTLALTQSGQAYTPAADDVIRFALSKKYVNEEGYELILTRQIPTDTLTFTLSAAETEELEYTTYNYDVQITHGDGSVDTVASSKMTVTEEVE